MMTESALLKGEICMQYTTCGKPNCRCRSGERHGPYYYRVWREGDKVRKAYIPQAQLSEVQSSCAAYRQTLDRLRQIRGRIAQTTRTVRREHRAAERMTKSG